ncbi:MAG: ribose-5-phosphate isomerase RpiA [Bacteroidota bacterium]
MTVEEMKHAAAGAALAYVQHGMKLGIGTGSTANHFIDLLGECGIEIEGAVASSLESEKRLKQHGIPLIDLNDVNELPLYIDGADESNDNLQLIKGGGGALTREKIIAAASQKFICIADVSKKVETLGSFPLPVEVVPMAAGYVSRRLQKLGGRPTMREGFLTDNGNRILDVRGLKIEDPIRLEKRINNIAGVVTVGLFASRPADLLILSGPDGVRTIGWQ